jgi:hypothetical protein
MGRQINGDRGEQYTGRDQVEIRRRELSQQDIMIPVNQPAEIKPQQADDHYSNKP